jgi:hypothetical protein
MISCPIGASVAEFATRRLSHICEMPRYRGLLHVDLGVQQKRDTKKVASETRGRNGASVAQFATRRPSSTRELPRYRVVLRGFRMLAGGDRTGWLGRQDSKLCISKWCLTVFRTCGRGSERARLGPPGARCASLTADRWNAQFRILPPQPAKCRDDDVALLSGFGAQRPGRSDYYFSEHHACHLEKSSRNSGWGGRWKTLEGRLWLRVNEPTA